MATKTKNTTIQIRIDEKTKRSAQKTLDNIGLDLSSAIKLFLKTVIKTRSIPFQLRTENGFTIAQELQIIREYEETVREGKTYDSYDEMVADIMDEDDNE